MRCDICEEQRADPIRIEREDCHKKRAWDGWAKQRSVAAVAVDHRPILSSSVSRVQAKMKAEKRERETNFLRDVARITIGRAAWSDSLSLGHDGRSWHQGGSRLLRIEEGRRIIYGSGGLKVQQPQ